jgi:hypothetical protein
MSHVASVLGFHHSFSPEKAASHDRQTYIDGLPDCFDAETRRRLIFTKWEFQRGIKKS